MQERRFLHPIKHKLLYANLIIYCINIILLVVFTPKLMWAQKNLRAYLWTGDFSPTADALLIQKAQEYLNTDESPERSEQLLQRSLAIDPYSRANLWLSVYYLRRGDDDKMLSYCDRYRSINPGNPVAYQLASRVLAKKQDSRRLNQLITEGLKHFRKRVELYQPHLDPNVPAEFNLKASTVYKTSKEGLAYLEGIKRQLVNQD